MKLSSLFWLVVLSACMHEDSLMDPSGDLAGATTIEVTPASVRVLVGDTVRLTASALNALGAPVSGVTFTWTSRRPAAASLLSVGLVRGAALPAGTLEDTAWIVVSAGGALRDSARVVVADPSIAPAPRFGTNLDMVNDWSTEWPFTDLFRESRPWISQRTGAPWGEGGPLALTSEGWVASLESAQYATTIMLTDPAGSQPGGDYVLLFDGDGDLTFDANPGVTVLTTAPGRTTVRLAPRAPAFIGLHRTNASNPIRNIRLVAAASEAVYQSSQFNADFLRVMRPFGVLRFMNWQATNRNPPYEWANRSRSSLANYAGPWGVPVESMVSLSNETGSDAWFCMPHNATDDYVRQFATLVRARLGPAQKVYVELSNELWNSLFPQATYAADRGQVLALATDRYQGALRWQAQRSVEMFAIWRSVFGADSGRVVRVLAAQTSNTWTAEQMLSWRDAFRQTDVLAIAPYFGGRLGGRDGSAEAAMSETQVLDALASELETTTRVFIEANARIARTYGVRLMAYEGGQHLVSANVLPQYEASVTRLFTSVNRHARMGDLYRRYFEIWYQAGGDLFVNFVAVGSWGKYGSWGALEFVHQDPSTSPKYQAVIEAAARWGRP